MGSFVLGITGKRASGKDTVANYLNKKHKFVLLTFTNDVLGPMLKANGDEITRDNLINLAMDLRKQFGRAALARLISERIHKDGKYVISGVRTKHEVEFFRDEYDFFRLVSVECTDRKRYERSKKRKQKGEEKLTFKEFMLFENKPTEKPIPEIMKNADYNIKNNGTKKELIDDINKMIKNTTNDV